MWLKPIACAALFFSVTCSASAATLIGGVADRTDVDIYRGTIASVTPCASSGYAFSFQGGATLLVFDRTYSIAFPSDFAPVTGERVFVVLGGSASCAGAGGATVGRAVLYFAPTELDEQSALLAPGGGVGTGGTGDSGVGDFGSSLTDRVQNLISDFFNPPQSAPTAGNGAPPSSFGALSPFNFGGVIGTPIPCDPLQSVPSGLKSFLVPIAGPLPGDFMYAPPLSRSWLCAPPLAVGMPAFGSYVPGGVCDVCFGSDKYCPLVATGIMDAGPGHGVGGCAVPSAPPSAPASTTAGADSCRFTSMPTNTPAAKLAAETQARKELSACGVSVTSSKTNGAPCALGQNGLSAGCTDVSGFKCEAVTGICAIAQKCPLTITGGSEAGHQGHRSGREVDVAVDPACIARNFQSIDSTGCRYVDPATGTTFRNEAVCRAERTTGPHFHICVNGGC